MSFTANIDPERNLVVMKIGGNISVAELVEGYSAIFEHPDFRPNMSAIWDLSSLNLKTIPISEVRQLPGEFRKFMDKRGDFRAALVTNRATDYHLLRAYLAILKLIGTNIRYRLFKTLDEAYPWVTQGE